MSSPFSCGRYVLLTSVGLIAGWNAVKAAEVAPGERLPNVVFILADDLGWTDLACYGGDLAHLEKRGLTKRTLAVFTSDNGGFIGNFRGQRVTDNAPIRSGKGSLYEGGIRVPTIIRLPGMTPQGSVCAKPILCTDFFRTVAELAGAEASTAVDGVSLLPLLADPSARLERDALFFHYPHYYPTTTPVGAVRSRDWKLLEYFEDNRVELFNLKDDMGETTDVAAKSPDVATNLRADLHAWRERVGAQMPTVNPAVLDK